MRGSHGAPSLLRAATRNGHAGLGWHEAGSLQVGGLADFTSLRLDTVRTAGTSMVTALESAVFAAGAADVHHVVVDGEIIVADGRHVRIDVAAELASVIGELMGQ